ncbi:MAG: MBL fold metallo-hydrolase, partial [Ottowia sp.]|nr:MBL fold metallo-hydrolase [Ottowia sp.]
MLRFCSLASGSSGNATLVEASSGTTRTRVLIDAGLGLRELGRRLARIGVAVAELDALFITHEHSDHIGCAPELAARHGIPLWASLGTLRAAEGRLDPATARVARDGEAVAVGDLQLLPFTVPHDAREPLQLRCTD